MLRSSVLLVICFALISVAHAQQPAPSPAPASAPAPAPAANSELPTVSGTNQLSASGPYLIRQALDLAAHRQLDAALDKINAAIQADPQNVDGFGIRGGIYVSKKQWDAGTKDYQQVLQMDPNNSQAKFNLAEIQFLQKKFDLARPGFLALVQDKDLNDLASYKVFLCDLFAGHEDVASKELEAFDKSGPGPSFYFGKAAWALYYKQYDDARSWIGSAAGIYAPPKFQIYIASLIQLGYLPIPGDPPLTR